MVLIVLFCNIRLRDSRLGRAWIAIREDEVAATSMGIPAVKTKLLAYAAGAGFGGMAGAFLGAFLNHGQRGAVRVLVLDPRAGDGHPGRPRLDLGGGDRRGRAVLHRPPDHPGHGARAAQGRSGFTIDASQLSFGVFGFLLVVMMVLRPEGLLPERRRKLEMTEGVGTGGESVYEARA